MNFKKFFNSNNITLQLVLLAVILSVYVVLDSLHPKNLRTPEDALNKMLSDTTPAQRYDKLVVSNSVTNKKCYNDVLDAAAFTMTKQSLVLVKKACDYYKE